MIGYLGAAGARRKNYFLAECECKIHLDNDGGGGRPSEILTNEDVIRGRITFYLLRVQGKVIEFRDLRIQLEAIATTRFQTKFDGRITNQFTDDRFLPEDATPSSYLCHHFIREGKPMGAAYRSVGKGLHCFPFELRFGGETLPPTFQNSYGRIQYKLVVYGGSSLEFSDMVAAEKYLTTRGCLNLSQDPSLGKPLVVTRKKTKSLFSNRPTLKAHLMISRRGFLSEDQLVFQFDVDNVNGESVARLVVCFVQKIIYFANKANKPTTLVLDQLEFCCESNDPQIHWEASMTIPTNLMPSFSKKKKSVEILYFLQFAVELTDKVGLKGETPIVIGTKRDNDDEGGGVTTGRLEAGDLNVAGPSSSSSRRSSIDSTWDTISIQTCSTLPPSYSKLSSRRPSLETLPPAYEDVQGSQNFNWDDNEAQLDPDIRPRCNSNVM